MRENTAGKRAAFVTVRLCPQAIRRPLIVIGLWIAASTGCLGPAETGGKADGGPAPAASQQTAATSGSQQGRPLIAASVRREGDMLLFEWQPVKGAASYIILVYDGVRRVPVWSWSGRATRVRYGDSDPEATALAGAGRAPKPAPPVPALPQWVLLAFDDAGQIIGGRPRGGVQ